MISYVELMVLVVYAAMAGYIIYLQHQLKKAHKAVAKLMMILHDIASGEVEIKGASDGFSIARKRKNVGEASSHQRGA